MDPFFEAYLDRLAALHGGIATELDDLPVEALDWVPGREMNSLAVLAAHAAGAEQHWIGEVAGQRPPRRVRQVEFEVHGRDAAALLALLDDSFTVAQAVLAALSPAELANERTRANGEVTSVSWALLHALEHTAQHMGHIQIGRQLWDARGAHGLRGEDALRLLGAEDYRQARDFLLAHGRPLEQALFRYHFENGPRTAVFDALATYANPDGGFGHALEPDVRTPSSSALATEIALRHLAALDAPADHPLVAGALAYCQATLDPDTLTWRVIPPDSNDYPHAPWWHDEDGSLARTFDDFAIIPRAGLVAALLPYNAALPAGWLQAIAADTATAVLGRDLGDGGGDDLAYALRFAGAWADLGGDTDELVDHLRKLVAEKVSTDPDVWEEYVLKPLTLAPRPDELVAGVIERAVQEHLDWELLGQDADGAWEPTWSWGDTYPEAWAQARDEWRSGLTLETLEMLAAYNRLPAVPPE